MLKIIILRSTKAFLGHSRVLQRQSFISYPLRTRIWITKQEMPEWDYEE